MTLEEFKRTVATDSAPDVPPLLRALWHDAGGDWQTAHAIAQDVDDEKGAWVHAYLHRKEGDRSNARYWYRQAHKPEALDSLDAEWTRIVSELL